MISRGKSRFVDEVRIPSAKLRSSAELLSELQKAEGGESCLAQSKTGFQETGAAHVASQTSIKETCADTLSVSPSFFTQRTIPTTERKWKVILANSSHGGALSIAVSKMVTRMVRHITTKMNDNLTQHWDTIRPVLLKAFATQHWIAICIVAKKEGGEKEVADWRAFAGGQKQCLKFKTFSILFFLQNFMSHKKMHLNTTRHV